MSTDLQVNTDQVLSESVFAPSIGKGEGLPLGGEIAAGNALPRNQNSFMEAWVTVLYSEKRE